MFEYVDQTNYTYKVADANLATAGREALNAATTETSPFAAIKAELEAQSPLKGMKITCSVSLGAKGVALAETLKALGATVRVCAATTTSTENELAAVLAADEVSIFAWKGESLAEFWWCARKALDFGDNVGPDAIIDEAGKLQLLISEGERFADNFDLYGQNYSEAPEETMELVELLRMVRGRVDWHKVSAAAKTRLAEPTPECIRTIVAAK